MKKINKFALTAIAVVSIAMILSTGITAAKQASVKSPLFTARTKTALGLEAPKLSNDSPESQLVGADESPGGVFATCPMDCTSAGACTHFNCCTHCNGCALQMQTKELEIRAWGADESKDVSNGVLGFTMKGRFTIVHPHCTLNGCPACTSSSCPSCAVQVSPDIGYEINSFQ